MQIFSLLIALIFMGLDVLVIATDCVSASPPAITTCTYGFPLCTMPENYFSNGWNEVVDSTGVVISGAVCTAAVCGRNGEWRQAGYPPTSTYIESPIPQAGMGRYCTNGIYEMFSKARFLPGSIQSFSPEYVLATQQKSIGSKAKQNVLPKSQYKSAKYVRKAIESALNVTYPQTVANAKDMGPVLISLGFKKRINYNSSSYIDGDVVVWSAGTKGYHVSGHVQIYYNTKWYSDFKQKSFCPWNNAQKSTPKAYRYSKLPW